MHMLVASGGSSHSRLAADHARALVQAFRAHGVTAAVDLVCVTGGSVEHCDDALASLAERMGDTVGRTLIRNGKSWREIVAAATEGAYGLVVVGEKGHHGLARRIVLGSTASKVATRADRPELVVKAKPNREPEESASPNGSSDPDASRFLPKKILVTAALHDRARGARLLRRVGPLADVSGAEVVLLHVMSQLPSGPGSQPVDWRASAQELLEQDTDEGRVLQRDLELLAGYGVSATPRVRHGLVVDEIRDELAEGDFDLLCVGGHERGSWLDSMLIEDVSHDLLEAAPCSVLVVNGPTLPTDLEGPEGRP